MREITREAYAEAEIVQPKDTKQTAAEDLSKRLKDSRLFSDAASQRGKELGFALERKSSSSLSLLHTHAQSDG